ncbi:hypothetical protein H0H92_006024 [Tricholoma furcatifolium]|nr:hypothetical protein H0H92_006024 [Tricholoma furcatifolium]
MQTDKQAGVPAALASHITHLQLLLKNLPLELPLNPPGDESSYHFYLDHEDVENEGIYYAFNRRLEICFGTYLLMGKQITFKERGERLHNDLIKLFRKAVKELPSVQEHNMVEAVWLERLIKAAKDAGARIPSKKRKVISSDDEATHAAPLQKQRQGGNHTQPIVVDSDVEAIAPNLPELIELSDDEDDEEETPNSPIVPPAIAPAAPQLPQPLRQATLFTLGLKRCTKEEAVSQTKKSAQEHKLKMEDAKKREADVKMKTMERKKALNRARQQRFRDRKAASGDSVAKVAKDVVLHGERDRFEHPDLAELSRPEGASWKKKRTGKHKGVVHKRHSRINWYHPFLWADIAHIAPRVGWSSTLIASVLQRDKPELYKRLTKGTIHKWISKSGRQWSTATLKNVERGRALAGSGRVGILSPYPEIVEEIKKQFKDLRSSSVAVSRMLGRSIILAIVEERAPQLLKTFKCTEFFVGQFFESVMNWTIRHGTRAAAHIPDNATELCERTFFRLFHLLFYYDIPLKLLINMDQTGILILLSHLKTFHDKGARQVDIVGKDEKRAYTLCVATSAEGDILPFQQVWAGKTEASVPSKGAPGYTEALDLGIKFTTASSNKKTSHFSTLKTMKEWMTDIYVPYVQSVIEADNLPADQKSILLLNCYPVHVGEEFRSYVRAAHPNVFLMFVPANCTGIFQPADVGIQRILKHFLRQETLTYLVDSHRKQVANGLTPAQVKFTTSLPALRDASVQPIVNLFNYLSSSAGRKIIQQAWEKCTVKEWNLGAQCLTDRRTKVAYRDYLHNDTMFRKEIQNKLGQDATSDIIEAMEPESDHADNFEDESDDTGIPLDCIIHQSLGLEVAEPNYGTKTFCLASASIVEGADGHLHAGVGNENVWTFQENGQGWVNGELPLR